MAKKDLRAQMDAARAAAAFIGAAQETMRAEAEKDVGAVAASAEAPKAASPAVEKEKAAPTGVQAESAATAEDAPAPTAPEPKAAAPEPMAAAPASRASKRVPRQVKSAASDVTIPATVPDFFAETMMGAQGAMTAPAADAAPAAEEMPAASAEAAVETPAKPKRARKPRKKAVEVEEVVEVGAARMTAQVLVPMTAEQREHADLLAQVMKITRAEVMRQALDEYWDNHKSELQAAVAAYEQLIRKLMK